MRRQIATALVILSALLTAPARADVLTWALQRVTLYTTTGGVIDTLETNVSTTGTMTFDTATGQFRQDITLCISSNCNRAVANATLVSFNTGFHSITFRNPSGIVYELAIPSLGTPFQTFINLSQAAEVDQWVLTGIQRSDAPAASPPATGKEAVSAIDAPPGGVANALYEQLEKGDGGIKF